MKMRDHGCLPTWQIINFKELTFVTAVDKKYSRKKFPLPYSLLLAEKKTKTPNDVFAGFEQIPSIPS